MNTPKQRLVTVGNLVWLAVYLAAMAGVVWGMVSARSWATRSLTTPEASADWEAFRSEARKLSEEGPVERRIPPSSAPPTLRLLRDHFAASLAAALFFSTAVFAATMLMMRGVFSRRRTDSQRFADVEPPP